MPTKIENYSAYRGLDDIGKMFAQVKQSVALSLSIVYVERGASMMRAPYSDNIVGDPKIRHHAWRSGHDLTRFCR